MLKKLLMFSLILNTSTYIIQATEVSTKKKNSGRHDLISFKEDSTPEKLLSHLEAIISKYSIRYIVACMCRQRVNLNIHNENKETIMNLLLNNKKDNKQIRKILKSVSIRTGKRLYKLAKNIKAGETKTNKQELSKEENKDDNHEELSEDVLLQQMAVTAEQMSEQLGLD